MSCTPVTGLSVAPPVAVLADHGAISAPRARGGRTADEPHNHGYDEQQGIDEKSVIAFAKQGGISRNEAEQASQ